jgi:hypothetical protein
MRPYQGPGVASGLLRAQMIGRLLDGWLRRRLRQVRWKEWKTTAAKRRNLRIRGISETTARKWAGSSKGYWRVAGSKVLRVSLLNSSWNRLGLKTLSQTWQRLIGGRVIQGILDVWAGTGLISSSVMRARIARGRSGWPGS